MTLESVELVEGVDFGEIFLVLVDVGGAIEASIWEIESAGVRYSVGRHVRIEEKRRWEVTNLILDFGNNVVQERSIALLSDLKEYND